MSRSSKSPRNVVLVLDVDQYYWLLDKLEVAEDQRNKLNIQAQTVQMHREYLMNFENGLYFAKIMQ
jgi:hypothetical protein